MKNIVWQTLTIDRQDREKLLKQRPFLLWFTGLSGSGKSTIANGVAYMLHSKGKLTYILDGDNVRHGLNKDLGFSQVAREENIRRIAEVSKLFLDCGVIVLAAFISPYKKDRDLCRKLVGEENFVEIYTKATIEVCEQRDPKGHYRKVREGKLKNFTGVDAPYEIPVAPEIVLDTGDMGINESVEKVMVMIRDRL